MLTIGEVYDPLIRCALDGDIENGQKLLRETGRKIFESHPGVCRDEEDGIRAALRNLDYYCQYYGDATAAKVKVFYQLNGGFRALNGIRLMDA